MPIRPDTMPARSEPWPSVADTVCTACACISTGVEPYCRIFARSVASVSEKPPTPPLMSTWLLSKKLVCGTGAETTRWSSTIAMPPVAHSGARLKQRAVQSFQASIPSAPPCSSSSTCHSPLTKRGVDDAMADSPSANAGPISRISVPSRFGSTTVASGRSASFGVMTDARSVTGGAVVALPATVVAVPGTVVAVRPSWRWRRPPRPASS